MNGKRRKKGWDAYGEKEEKIHRERERGSVGRRRVKRRKKENKEQRAILNAYHSAM